MNSTAGSRLFNRNLWKSGTGLGARTNLWSWKLMSLSSSSSPSIGVGDGSPSSTPTKKDFPRNMDLVIDNVNVNNRNPRNLEKLRIAERVSGWGLDKPGKSYWNKLTIELTGKHITTKVVHVLGHIPISASTNEWCIKRFLYSTRDFVAAKTVGQVLAHRCLQLGITELSCFVSEDDRKKEKISLIIGALEEAGITLQEPEQIEVPWSLNYPTLPEKSWEVHEDISNKLGEADNLIKYFKKGRSKSRD